MHRFLHLTVLSFAAWTVICNLVVLNHGNLRQLGGALGIALVIGISALLWQRRWLFPTEQAPSEKHPDALNGALWFLALGIALVLTLMLNRPDADDAFYVNMAVAAADHPAESLLCCDTMHHLTGGPILLPFYKLYSLELLAALAAWLTRLPAIGFLHLAFPPLAALLALLAYRRLFMRLTPQFWGFATLATCLFLCANGDAHASFGNLSWVRLHQGKGILVTAMLPIVIDAALAYASKPSFRRFFYLSATQIAAAGVSGSALFVVPLLALLTAGASLSGPGKTLGRTTTLLGVAASSLYPLLAAGLIAVRYPLPDAAFAPIRSTLVVDSLHYVFGAGPFAYACVLVVVGVCFLAGTPTARRLGRFCALFALLVVSNPLLAPFIAEHLMGDDTFYWRLYWILPLPLFAGLFCCIPLELPHVHVPRSFQLAAYAGVVLAFVAVLPRQRIFDESNHVRFGKPGLKVPPGYGVVQAVAANLNSGDSVLMPDELSPWLPTLHHAARPVLSRQAYAYLYPADLRATVCAAQTFISQNNAPADGGDALTTLIGSMNVRAVCFSGQLDHATEIAGILKRHGFTVSTHPSTAPYTLVVRTEPRAPDFGTRDGVRLPPF